MPKIGQVVSKRVEGIKPYWQSLDKETAKLWQGNCLDVLKSLPEKSVQCVITSPPYWGLRDYSTGSKEEIGCEEKLDSYLSNMLELGVQIKRVLRDDGVFWLNLGDTYISTREMETRSGTSLGNTACIPWKVALTLQQDGWILRQDCIWAKPDPMPEPVKDRCVKSHEYFFLFTKSSDYFFDMIGARTTRNLLSVFNVSKSGFKGAHFATYPPKLIEPLIKMSTSEYGCCAKCQAPWKRITEREGAERTHRVSKQERDRSFRHSRNGIDSTLDSKIAKIKTVGWKPTCNCGEKKVISCTLLDPFIGSGTTAAVAIELGRRCWGIDLSETYLKECAIPRILNALPY